MSIMTVVKVKINDKIYSCQKWQLVEWTIFKSDSCKKGHLSKMSDSKMTNDNSDSFQK